MRRFGICLLLVLVGGACVWGQVISGEWQTDIEIDPSQSDFAAAVDFGTDLKVNYEVGGWTFTSTTTFNDLGWSDQTFSAGGLLGAFSFSSTLDLAPTGAFDGLDIAAGIGLGGMTFDLSFELFDQDTELTIGGTGSTSLVTIDVDVTFGGDDNDVCDLPWAGLEIEAAYPFCCGQIRATLEFDCDGFEYVTFEAQNIEVPNLAWLELSASVTFRVETKSLVLSPRFDFGDDDLCFDVYVSQDATGGTAPDEPLVLGGFHVNGIKLECTFAGVTFTGISYWGSGSKPSGLGEYWEMYRVESEIDECCGPFGFEAALYFLETSNNLADVERLFAEIEYRLSDNVEISSSFDLDVGIGLTEWVLGFKIDF